MNFLSIVALILAGVVFGFGVLTATDNPKMFLDTHAILIVIGGSVAASSIAFQMDRIFLLVRVFSRRVLAGKKQDYVKIIEELMKIADGYRTTSPQLRTMIEQSKEPFLKEAMTAVLDGIMDKHTLVKVLRTRVQTIYHRQSDEANKFKIIGKYPPAFGLMGTTLGMIALLQKIGQPGGQKMIGPAMSIALVATLYGIVLANLVVLPISENLADSSKEMKTKNTIIVEGVILIMEKVNPVVLAEELNSYLLPSERIDWKKTTTRSAGKKAA